ncbi:MAG: hypothetical protein JWN86_990 [Planctomycetota bacterium]|nr:hypothetical protein [Planctomycetota bacterium]
MDRYVVLDSSPLGAAVGPGNRPITIRCREWLDRLKRSGTRVIVPAITDYEVRRDLIRRGVTVAITRLNALGAEFEYDPLNREILHLAASCWAQCRRKGLPTADPHALDADVILAAQAMLMGNPGDSVIVATSNVRHLARFVDARDWATIV